MRKGISTAIVLLAVIVLIAVAIVTGYIYGKNSQKTSEKTVSQPQTGLESPTQSLSPSPLLQEGTITGTLGYPSEFLPKGKIFAKNLDTGKLYSVDYEGAINGKGADTYSITVPKGQYYLKYEAHADTNNPSSFINGYYTDYDGTASDKSHNLVTVEVKAGEKVENIKIFDFYYDPSNEPKF